MTNNNATTSNSNKSSNTPLVVQVSPPAAAANTTALQERLPASLPLFVFFTPTLFGIVLAVLLERYQCEGKLRLFLEDVWDNDEPYALVGLGFVCITMVCNYLSGCVVHARIAYNVPAPLLYAASTHNSSNSKSQPHPVDQDGGGYIAYNCIQRSHQNFLERYGELALCTMFLVSIVDRPNIAGLILILVSVLRILYTMAYQSKININARTKYVVMTMILANIGVGYGALLAMNGFGGMPLVVRK